ncbi:MAG: hypothetical protein HN531_07825 [Opitutae bacterium]|nr:hypothetical protein [Opitutae bacterium]
MDVSLLAEELTEHQTNPLFQGKTWRWSPSPWQLPPEQKEVIEKLAQAGVSFYRAIERLYLKSKAAQKILRNEELFVPWVAEYYDAGKPDWLVNHASNKAVSDLLPAVLRPDLLPVSGGTTLTEWDSVPGGIGVTAQLGSAYLGEDAPSMVDAFGEALAHAASRFGGKQANMLIVVSDESETYRPEMEWLADELSERGFSIGVADPGELEIRDEGVFNNGKKVDLVYRFWELFDWENVPVMKDLSRLVEEEKLVVTPPMKHFQEEKLSLALFWHHRLQGFWEENLSRDELELLRSVIPKTWILDPALVPPGATVDGPPVQGKPLGDWMELAKASKKERILVIKASGFHESAWGARSVVVGDDVSSEQWTAALSGVLESFPQPLSVLQEFRKPVRLEHPVFTDDGSVESMTGRLRLSPYFFVSGDQAKWSGSLATFCPADKKIIHGMKDGALMPCGASELI